MKVNGIYSMYCLQQYNLGRAHRVQTLCLIQSLAKHKLLFCTNLGIACQQILEMYLPTKHPLLELLICYVSSLSRINVVK
jgi:hypothetical protein